MQDREHYFEFASESDSIIYYFSAVFHSVSLPCSEHHLVTNMSTVEAAPGREVGLWRQVRDLDVQAMSNLAVKYKHTQ